MSYQDGLGAMELRMPDRVPRTEFSAELHWDLVKEVTGIQIDESNTPEQKQAASCAFFEAWNYDLKWGVYLVGNIFEKKRTTMGHGVYAAGGTDFSTNISCPFSNEDEVLTFDPEQVYGTPDKEEFKRKFEAHYANNCKLFPDAVNTSGTYVTLMSGLIDILGWDMLLLAAGTDPDGFGEVANRYARYMMPYYEALAESNIPIIMIHDDIVWTEGPFLHPDWYRKYLFPNYKKMLAPIMESGKKVLFTSDGDYTYFIDDIAALGFHGFVMEPLTDMKYIAEKYGKTHVFVGNADTRVLLSGTKEDIYAEVKRCMDIGKNCPGFFMAVGNHIPANTPVDNALYYNQAYEKLGKR